MQQAFFSCLPFFLNLLRMKEQKNTLPSVCVAKNSLFDHSDNMEIEKEKFLSFLIK